MSSVGSSALRPELVIGIGPSFRRDDGAGPAVARALTARGHPAVVHEGEGSALIDLWDGRRHVVVVDAMIGGTPGTVRQFDADSKALQAVTFIRSTHDLGLAEAIGLGRQFGRLPGTLSVIAIAGSDFAMGETMSAPVRAAVATVIESVSDTFREPA